MIIQINLQALARQIRHINNYASLITTVESRQLMKGVANLLSEIQYAVENDEEIEFRKAK